jgi:uncharacterized protein YegJ (DUF2314 family)
MEIQQKRERWIITGAGILLVIVVGLFFWRSIQSKEDANRKSRYVSIEETDPGMQEAARKARTTIGDFIEMMKNPKQTISYFALKVRCEENGTVEHVWLNFITYDGTEFEGNIANDPLALRTYSFGKTVRVSADRISDWMVIDDGFLVGGYTLHVLRNRMTEQEKKAFDEKGGFKVK